MSAEAPKAVEETPVAVPAAATETPAAPAADAPAAAEPAKEEETKKEEAKKEETKVEPATEGILGYKAPPLLKSLRFSKRYFWFSDDAVEVKKLWNYMGSEKPVVAHPTAAWASQSGKGLLFVTKHIDDKDHPLAVLNLTDLTDLHKEGHLEVSFKLGGGKHVLQATSALERDGWFVALENKSTEGKAEKETITASEGYKTELEKLTKPVHIAAKKAVEDKGKEAAKKDEAATETPATTTDTPAAEAAKKKEGRGKRVSVFLERIASGTGRPEEKAAEKKEEKKEEAKKEEAKPEVKPEAEAAPAVTTEAAPAVPPKTEEKKEEKKDEKPTEAATKAKRASLFGDFFRKASGSSAKEPEKKEEPVKDTPPVSSTAPQLADPVKDTEPIKPETVTQAPAATEAAKEPAKEEPKKEEPAASSLKDKIFGSIKKLETQVKPEEKKEAKPEEKKAETKEEVKKEEPKPETAATAPAEPALLKDGKRRVSTLLGNLSKKEKKPETTPAEGDKAETEAKAETKAKSPITSRIGSVFRKQKPSTKSTEPVPAVAATEKAEEPKKEEAPAPAAEPATAPAVNGHGTNGTAATEEPAKPVEGTAPAAPAVQATA